MLQDVIADLAERTMRIAENLVQQLVQTQADYKSKYVHGVLNRQILLLENVTATLRTNQPHAITSTFILLRCLLDDFITVLYLKHKGFHEGDIVNHTANAFHERFKTIAASKQINNKFFEGAGDGLVDDEREATERAEFLGNPENDRYFKNKAKFEFKDFPSVTAMTRLLPQTDLGLANAHAFVVWRHLSHYVHFSLFTYQLQSDEAIREIELKQLKEVLSYCYKSLVICHEALTVWGREINFDDDTNVFDDINNPEFI
jgi:hypothetical protein